MDVLQKLGKIQQIPKIDRIPYYELYFPEQRENTDIIRTIKKCTMVRNRKSYQRAVEKKNHSVLLRIYLRSLHIELGLIEVMKI